MPKKQKTQKTPDELATIRDFIRYGVTRFNAAGIAYGHGTDNAFDEASYLVLETLNLPHERLADFIDARLTKAERVAVTGIIEKRIKTRKPAAYLTNKAYIQGMPFYVDERVIVPRSFIGELLCADEGLPLDDLEEIGSVLDLCTGSGCLAIVAANVFPFAEVDAVDLSPAALEVAKRNVKESALEDRITLYKGDLFQTIKNKKYDLIITNPPYVDAEAMKALPPEYRHEPKLALASGKDGLDIVRRIIAEAADHLHEGGALLCEVGRGKDILEDQYPHLPFLWFDTEASSGEVFWLTREQLATASSRKQAG